MAEEQPEIDPERLKQITGRLRKNVPDGEGVGCILCKWILGDLLADGRLSGAMPDAHKTPTFPRSGELAHLKLEGIITSEEGL